MRCVLLLIINVITYLKMLIDIFDFDKMFYRSIPQKTRNFCMKKVEKCQVVMLTVTGTK